MCVCVCVIKLSVEGVLGDVGRKGGVTSKNQPRKNRRCRTCCNRGITCEDEYEMSFEMGECCVRFV